MSSGPEPAKTGKEPAEELIPLFDLEKVLNQDQAGRRIALLGKIKEKPALLILERAPFVRDTFHLQTIPTTLRNLKNLGANDIYYWYMACSGTAMSHTGAVDMHEDLKINLIYPCTEKHIKKYSEQGARMVTETAEIYEQKVRPYMAQQRDAGRLQWVWNIIDGKTEVEDVIYRTVKGVDVERGFLLLPDLNWDRKTIESLHLLGLIERMDIWSVRDLKKKHVPWLKEMRAKILEATVKAYPAVEEDQLKLYIHYQPTYYHFHIHIVHVKLESGATQATGKAMGLDNIISQLEHMAGDEEAGMHLLDLTYGVGEASELWTEIFEPIKNAKKINNVTEK